MKISPVTYPSGHQKWRLDLGLIQGKRIRHFFDTREQAEGALRASKIEQREIGQIAAKLSNADRIEFALAKEKLDGLNVSFREVVEFYLAHNPREASRQPIEEVFENFMRGIERKRRHPRYLYDLRRIFATFVRDTGIAQLADVTSEIVEQWVCDNKLSSASQRHRLALVRPLFTWAKKRRMIAINPVEGALFEFADKRKGEPLAFGIKECRAMLQTAVQQFPELIGYLTLGMFLGVRPEESSKLSVESLSLENSTLLIPSEIAKSRRRRVIELPSVAEEWFAVWLDMDSHEGKFQPPNFRRRWNRFRETSGLAKTWIHDGLRHTFASMHYAAHQNVSQLKAMMGHGESEQVLFDHYRAVQTGGGETITRKMAGEFWKLSPEQFA
jgi:integrase